MSSQGESPLGTCSLSHPPGSLLLAWLPGGGVGGGTSQDTSLMELLLLGSRCLSHGVAGLLCLCVHLVGGRSLRQAGQARL